MKDGREAIKALSWTQVRGIVDSFARLNPYDRSAVPGSILKIEDVNFVPKTKKQREVWCYAIAAKRYALILRNKNGAPVLLREGANDTEDRWKEHGLGHLLNPTDPQSEDRKWIAQLWEQIIRRALGFRTRSLGFEKVPAVGRVSVSSPWVMKALESFNKGKTYPNQIKPFNFLLSAHVRELGHPIGVNPERFHLIAPFETNARKCFALPWFDQYTGRPYRITSSRSQSPREAAVKTYGDVLSAYEYHPEPKCAGADGKPCSKQTVGLLSRRQVRVEKLHFIGKESNQLDEVEEGSIHDAGSVYTEYPNDGRDDWDSKVLPIIKAMPMRELQHLSGLSRAALQAIRRGRRPRPRNQAVLRAIAYAHSALSGRNDNN